MRQLVRKLTKQDIKDVVGVENNGNIVIQARLKHANFRDSNYFGIALCKSETDCYSTWQFILDEDSTGFFFYWGCNHMENKESAIEDFNTRK